MILSSKPIPVGLTINHATGRVNLLINNEWLLVTKLIYCSPNCQGHIDPVMLDEAMNKIAEEVPGTVEWFNWGPRLN